MRTSRGHPQAGRADAVEPLGELEHRLLATVADRVADRPHGGDRRLDVDRRARQDRAQGARVQVATTQVDAADHAASLGKLSRAS